MRSGLSKILITGGAGFMGSEFVRLLVRDSSPRRGRDSSPRRGLSLIVVDKLTYAGDLERLKDVKGKYKFYKADICNRTLIESIFKKENPEIAINFSAETHVDRSIRDASAFIDTNIKGAQVLLEASRKYRIKRFIQVSSDEVYGEIKKGEFSEDSPLRPSSPYAASKAAADLLVKSYIRTYNFPAIIVRPCNNYGPWQYPEKLISLAISRALKNQKIPIYAQGQNRREWLFVSDCAEAILLILEKARIGEIYNIGSGQEMKNIDVAKQILGILGKPKSLIEFVQDRPGHDIRYKLNSQKVFHEIGWRPKIDFEKGLKMTVQWCLKNKNWLLSKWKRIVSLYE